MNGNMTVPNFKPQQYQNQSKSYRLTILKLNIIENSNTIYNTTRISLFPTTMTWQLLVLKEYRLSLNQLIDSNYQH